MIKQLRKSFKSLIVYRYDTDLFDSQYKWFQTEEQQIIGIKKEELTTREISLLTAFLTPYNTDFPPQTTLEYQWHQTLINPIDTELEIHDPYRFIYFTIKQNQISPNLFKNAIQELFPKPMPILWLNNHEGIIIDTRSPNDDHISFEPIIDVLMSDLYVNIRFFIGSFLQDLTTIQEYHKLIITGAKTGFNHFTEPVITFADVVPLLFIHHMNDQDKQLIAKLTLNEFYNDEETLQLIRVFVESNLNISETAKKLYMHRNSLQYRLDRFYDKTTLDLRQFKNALAIYLALLAKS